MKFKKIMLVDDDEASNFLHHHLITEMNLAKDVVVIENPEQALNYLQHCVQHDTSGNNCPDLLLLDVHMPGLDGFEFLAALETSGCRKLMKTCVVMLSSSLHPKDREAAVKLATDEYISKPLTELKMLEVIEKCHARIGA
jgi:CheY-like chemotaxis protein